MTAHDEFEYDDAAYVLGALDPQRRAAFETHLIDCAECTARVAELAAAPRWLAGVVEADFADPGDPPDTLLPGLLRKAGVQRRRQRWLTGSLAGLAAACLVALVIAVWPSGGGSRSPSSTGHPQAMQSLIGASPVSATAALVSRSWGTEIRLDCRYRGASVPGATYELRVIPRRGATIDAGSWTLVSGRDTRWSTGVAVSSDQIKQVQITLADGQPILSLTT
jgi:hypothetical protein